MKNNYAAKKSFRIVLSRILLLSLLCAFLLAGTSCGGPKAYEKSPYEKINLSKYVTLPTEKFEGASFTYTAPEEITDKTVTDYINYLKLNYITPTVLKDGGAVASGDIVSIWYRGLTDGKEFVGGSNLASGAYKLLIGSGAFIDGFEEALIGKDSAKYRIGFFTTSSREAKEDDIIFISYTFTYTETVTADGVEKTEEKTGTAGERVDLSAPREGLPATLIADLKGKPIGTKLPGKYTGATYDYNADLNAEDITIKDVTILKILDQNATNEPLTITVRFPEDYGLDKTTGEKNAMAGKEARFEVWFDSHSRAEITAEYLKNSLGITYETMEKSIRKTEGIAALSKEEQMVKAFPTYLKDEFLPQSREESIYSAKVSVLWKQLFKDAQVSEIPANLSQHEYDIMFAQAENYYASNASSFKDKADCFRQVWGLPGKDTSENGYLNELRAVAEEEAKNRMIFFYVAKQKNLSVTDKEYRDELDAAIKYYQQTYGSSFTEENVLSACGGQESFVFNLLYQKVSKALVEKNTFTPVASGTSSGS